MKKVGILGGTFDPVHCGHLELADYAIERFNLCRVIFIPSASPPHKKREGVASFQHRVEMLRCSIGSETKYSLSEIERFLPFPSYTIDTLNVLLPELTTDTEPYFIIGIDAFLDIRSWKKYKDVLEAVHFLVSARPGYDKDQLQDCMCQLKYNIHHNHWQNTVTGNEVHYLDVETTDISSSVIREKIKNNESLGSLVNHEVQKYIIRNNVYLEK